MLESEKTPVCPGQGRSIIMVYTAEVIAVGTELLLGGTANTDAQDVSCVLS